MKFLNSRKLDKKTKQYQICLHQALNYQFWYNRKHMTLGKVHTKQQVSHGTLICGKK